MRNRDELVFQYTRERNIPVVMVTSGGYQRNNAEVIARSILNLNDKKLIPGPGIVSETDKATSHLAAVAGQMGKEPAAKKKKAKGKVRMEDGRSGGDQANKLDRAAVQDEDNPSDLVVGGATGIGNNKSLDGAKLVGCESNVKGTEGFYTPEETDSEDAGSTPITAVVDTTTTHEQ